jgi:DNA-binding LacI/PurR family transcriptional regulator
VKSRDSITRSAVETLGGEVRAGKYAAGTPMPSENRLCARFGVSRMTVRVILARLERDGLIYRQQGRGTFAYPPAAAVKPVAFWLKDLGKVSSPYMSELIAGADSHLSGIGAHLSVTGAPLSAWSAAFCQSLAGVIVIPLNVDAGDVRRLAAFGLPHVTLMESDVPGPVVGMDPRGAARALTRGLLDLGHRRFALISGHRQHTDRQKRLGIAEALSKAKLRIENIPDLETDYEPDAARAAAEDLLRQPCHLTAVICFDDTLALQFISVAQRLGVRVPEDISVTGFNNSPFSALVSPPITTVRFPAREAGRIAARLVAEASTSGVAIKSVFLDHELIWRDSTGPAKGDHGC